MNKKLYVLIAIFVIFGILMTGCEKKLSTAPAPTSEKGFPTPLPLDLTAIVQATQLAAAEKAAQPTATPAVIAAATEVPVATAIVPTATPYTVPTLTRPTSYTLQKGEFPYCIARRYDLDAGSLLSLNGLNTASKPSVGYELKIPATGNWSAGSRALLAHPVKYTIKSGDTIYTIACAFGDVSPEALIAVNGLTSPYTLTAGTEIQIP